MILPNNGKVVIIDDQPKDVIELIASLSKEKIPFVHYKEEDLSDLPETPIENVRLIFLDLQLVSDTYMPEKNITSPIKTRLMRIIKPRTPYALVIWSGKEDQYKKALLEDFESEFRDYKPIICTSLPKSNIIGKEGAMGKIKKELEAEIEKFKSFNAFLVWEAIVNEASGKLTNDLTSLYGVDDSWNDKTKYLLHKLSVAYAGKTTINHNDIAQLKNAMYTLSMTLSDNIENAINETIDSKFSGLISVIPQTINNLNSMVNKLLLISDSWDDSLQPGTLFFCIPELEYFIERNKEDWKARKQGIENLKPDKREVALSSTEKKFSQLESDLQKKINEKRALQNRITFDSLIEKIKKDKENVDLRNAILSSSVGLEINITPLCDYAQEKAVLFRMLPGIMIKAKYREYINNNSAFTYKLDGDFRIDNVDYFILFDFRCLYAVEKKELSRRHVKYRIKQQLLSDIQVKLSSHINRAGVLFVE